MLKKNFILTSLFSNYIQRNANKIGLLRTMSTDLNDVIFENVNDKGIVILNRPKALNALNLSMVDKIYPTLKAWEKEKTLVIIKGVGEKAFCAGGDVRAIVEAGLKGDKLGVHFFRKEYMTNGLIGSYKIPYIAFADGIVMGGGVGLSVHGRYRVGTERTLFAMPETQIGLFPDVGGSYFLPRMQGRLGYYLALTGVRLKGPDVLKAGVVTHYCESKNLHHLETALLHCSNQQDIENALKKFGTNPAGEFSLAPHLEKINYCFGANTMEEIINRLNKDGSEWATSTLNLLNKMSPTSMKVTLKELEIGRNLSLQECLIMEYRLAIGCLTNKDFYEGVRALLIDKDQKPVWSPAKLSDVTDKLVDSHFSKLPDEQELKHKL